MGYMMNSEKKMLMNLSQGLESYLRNVDAAASSNLSLHELPQFATQVDDWLELIELELSTTNPGDIDALHDLQKFISNATTPLIKEQFKHELAGSEFIHNQAQQERLAMITFALGELSPTGALAVQCGEIEELKQAYDNIRYSEASNDPTAAPETLAAGALDYVKAGLNR